MTARTTRRTTAARTRTAAVGAIAVAGALILTGCGDQTNSGSDSSSSASTSSAPLADKLPKEIRDKGVIKVGSDIAYAPVEVCRTRDKTGAYAMADQGKMAQFPGVSAAFEAPTHADLTLPTHELSVEQSVDRILALMKERGLIP